MSRRKRKSSGTSPARPEAKTPPGSRFGVPVVLALIFLVTIVAYLPALQGGFIWDDDAHLTQPELRSWQGLYRIWFDLGATQQYYPLLHSAFWVEHKLWGDAPYGYHLLNVLLHATVACLVYLVLWKLAVPGAYLAAAIFALHPVHVESVAWISEQKNTLSGVFYLSAMLVYLRFDESRRKSFYGLALGLFALGLLSKTVTATLPAALLVIFWWQRGTLSWRRDVQPLIPFFLLGAGAGLFTAWVEQHLIGAEGADFELTILQRALLAGRVIWFYLGKLIWPANLIFLYPRWEVSPYVWWQWLPPIAALAVLVWLWAIRRQWRGPLAGGLLFVGTLFPVLGFLNVGPFVFSFVADHFQYLASLGVIVLVASGIALRLARLSPRARWAGNVVCLVLVVTLATLSWRQSQMYNDVIGLYQTTIDRNPTCWMAHYNLGVQYTRLGQSQKAIEHYRRAIELRPNLANAYNNLGLELARAGQTQQATECYEQALRIRPDYAQAHYNLGVALERTGQVQQAIEHYSQAAQSQLRAESSEAHYNLGVLLFNTGRAREAIDQFRTVLQVNPKLSDAYVSLAVALRQTGQLAEAIEQYQQAMRLDPDNLTIYGNLTEAYIQTNQPAKAVALTRQAVNVARSKGQTAVADNIEAWLADFQAGRSGPPGVGPTSDKKP